MTDSAPSPSPADSPGPSFAETALGLGGKSADEVRRMGALERADENVEWMFRPEYQTSASPVHRAIWERAVPADLFQSGSTMGPEKLAASPGNLTPTATAVFSRSLDLVRRYRAAGILYDAQGKLSSTVIDELAAVGYWGLLVQPTWGGVGARLSDFMPFLTQMATVSATVAGMASVHGCIGAVDPLQSFGTAEQRAHWLPLLASGQRLSAFALTEPGAGSDLTRLSTHAQRVGAELSITGEKLFITNAGPGRVVGLVVLFEEKPAVVVCELPDAENASFQTRRYGLHALRHSHNVGLVFRDFRVPLANLLTPKRGDGLAIAYHGLNRGRIAVCAQAAGSMRRLLASMVPWAKRRVTYGKPIVTRELVLRRIGRLAALIAGCDALTAWCSRLLDEGYRGELECIIAKVFGSEALREAAVELALKTHGGRSFLHNHLVGDYLHDYLAPSIYEGENELLGLALFKGLIKQHGSTYFEPLIKAAMKAGITKFDPRRLSHLWKVRQQAWPYGRWLLGRKWQRKASLTPGHSQLGLTGPLADHASAAAAGLQSLALELDASMRRHQLKLPDRQCRIAELSTRVQKFSTQLCVALYGAREATGFLPAAAAVLCRELQRELTGERVTDTDFRALTQLGQLVADGGFPGLDQVPVDEPPLDTGA